MKAIALWQPFASLIFVGAKRHETRSFRFPPALMGERIAIHAAKAFPAWRHISSDLHNLCYDHFGCSYHQKLPFGGIIGTVVLGECAPTGEARPVDDEDRIAGDWSIGRFAWRLDNPLPVEGGFYPTTGKQGWWTLSPVFETALAPVAGAGE